MVLVCPVVPVHAGDAVVGVTRFGAYTSHINLALPYLRRMPAGWSYEVVGDYQRVMCGKQTCSLYTVHSLAVQVP